MVTVAAGKGDCIGRKVKLVALSSMKKDTLMRLQRDMLNSNSIKVAAADCPALRACLHHEQSLLTVTAAAGKSDSIRRGLNCISTRIRCRNAVIPACEKRHAFESWRLLLQAKVTAFGGAPIASAPDPSLVPCPHCGRRFNEHAAERHIPKCQDIRAKPNRLMAGAGQKRQPALSPGYRGGWG